MTQNEIKAVIIRELGKIAPEVDPKQIDPDIELRQQVDLDSMDLLNLMIAVCQAVGVDVPEADYPRMATLNSAAAYLSARATGA